MPDNKEQIKQKIVIELENARVWSMFLVPLTVLFIAILFSNQYTNLFSATDRALLGVGIFAGIFIVILLRNEHIRSARKLIEQL